MIGKMKNRISIIWIDRQVADYPVTQSILQRASSIPIEIIDHFEEKSRSGISLTKGKQILYLTKQRGGLVKPCPATLSPYICCQYTVINQVMQCPLDCTYCILQLYLDTFVVTLNVNTDDIFSSVTSLLQKQPDRFFRFGTGEFGDSLALESLTDLSCQYIRFFLDQKNCLLELKTKTRQVESLLALQPKNVVVSWYINPQPIIHQEEFHSASLQQRLTAAKKCQERGYLIGLHFDPILLFPGWEFLYKDVVDLVFTHLDASRIAWISLGTLRFPPPLKDIIQKRFSRTRIIYEEMIRGMDGKMRYVRLVRVEMYKRIFGWLTAKAPDLFIYFCMESPSVWDEVTGKHPESNAELDFWFAQSIHQRFPEVNMKKPSFKDYLIS